MPHPLPSHLTLSREARLQLLASEQPWDLIVVGGGIVGAGVLRLAAKLGLKCLLVEQKDFAWGSSSRSSKMVHGGLRYLADGQLGLARESVTERQLLLDQAPHLVYSQSFLMSHYRWQFPWGWLFDLLLYGYDALAGKRLHKRWRQAEFQFLLPKSRQAKAKGGSQFFDGMTDDARLVLRLLQEAQIDGALAVNYVTAETLLSHKEAVTGLTVTVAGQEQPLKLHSKMVVNATGAWANHLSPRPLNLRPLRGSHLVLPRWRLPVTSVVAVVHPKDGRPVQIFPWQGATLVGTTDVEHADALNQEPRITSEEVDYLLACVNHQFPDHHITQADIISTFAGVRPVIAKSSRAKDEPLDPSKEDRHHSIDYQPGIISVAGGKLTTFRLIAQQVLTLAATDLGFSKKRLKELGQTPFFSPCMELPHSFRQKAQQERLQGIYGELAGDFALQLDKELDQPIGATPTLWAELKWALQYEQVCHLDDLLLRRTRLGNLLPKGGEAIFCRLKDLCQSQLDWSDERWGQELQRYQNLWQQCYSLSYPASSQSDASPT